MAEEEKKYIDEKVWKDYKKGDSVSGILVDILYNVGEYGNRIYKIQSDDVFLVVWGSSDLDKKMDKLEVGIGMKVKVIFNGLVHTENGFDMKDFTVVVLD